jgi:hypothetical protein
MKRVVVRNGVRYGRTRIIAPGYFYELVWRTANAWASRGVTVDPIEYTARLLGMSRGTYFKYRRDFLSRFQPATDVSPRQREFWYAMHPGARLLVPVVEKDLQRRSRKYTAWLQERSMGNPMPEGVR